MGEIAVVQPQEKRADIPVVVVHTKPARHRGGLHHESPPSQPMQVMQDALAFQPDLAKEMADRKAANEKKREEREQELQNLPEYARKSFLFSKEYLRKNPDVTGEQLYDFILRGGDTTTYKIMANYGESILKIDRLGNSKEIGSWIKQEQEKAKAFKQELPKYENLCQEEMAQSSGWVQVDSKQQKTGNIDQGRIYISPQIAGHSREGQTPHLTDIFSSLVSRFDRNPELFQTMKMIDLDDLSPMLGLVGTTEGEDVLAHKDRIVLYYDKEKQAEVMDFLNLFHKEMDQWGIYEDSSPLFTELVRGKKDPVTGYERKLWGISKADDPKRREGEPKRSRNQVLATALLRAKEDVGVEGINTPAFYEAFKGHLEYFGINPLDPAKNIQQGQEDVIEDQLAEEVQDAQQQSELDVQRQKHRGLKRITGLFKSKAA